MTTTNGELHEIAFGKQRIPFSVEFRARDRLGISVHPNRTVTVAAPVGRTVEEVIGRVKQRAAWIARQRRHFEQFQPLPPPRRYVGGETHFYLGRQYRLKLAQSDDETVKLVGRFLSVRLPNRQDSDAVRCLLDGWYLTRAKHVFARRAAICLESARSLNLTAPEIVVRKMKKRWGSCTKAGRVLLNLELVKTPPYCIEYVIMHELCHLKIHDHSPRFYRLLARCMPDWEVRKKRLESFIL